MKATGYITRDLPGHAAARGYLAGEDRGPPWKASDNIGGRPSWNSGIGAGGIVSNVGDLLRWAQALEGGRVLSAESLRKLFACQIQTGESDGQCYGYGWNIDVEDGRKLIWHDGSNGAFWARLSIYPESQLKVVVLPNKSIEGGRIVDRALRKALVTGTAPPMPPEARVLTPEQRSALVGEYDLEAGGKIKILQIGNDLLMEPRSDAALAMLFPLRGAEVGRVARLSSLSRDALKAAGDGDYEPLRRLSASESAYRSVREDLEYLKAIGSRADGFREFALVATGQRAIGPSGRIATYAEALFGKGEAPFRLSWTGERLSGTQIQTAASVNPPRLAIQGSPTGAFTGHNLELNRSIAISRAPSGTIILRTGGIEVTARKGK